MTYKIIELEQGSADWLALRKTKITATDTAKIMNLSPFCTPLMLWEEKLGIREPEPENDKMREGKRLEEEAREFWNKKIGSDFKPVVLVSNTYQFMMASLDGMNSTGEICEIKCGLKSHGMAENHEMAPYYYAQLQKQIYVADAKYAWFLSYRSDDDFIHFTVHRNDDFIEKMIIAETEFYSKLLNFEAPEMTDRDYVKRDDEFLVSKIERFKYLKSHIDEYESLRDEIIEDCENKSTICNGVKISKSVRKGNVKYKEIPELQGVDLDKYRGKSIESFRFTEMKE